MQPISFAWHRSQSFNWRGFWIWTTNIKFNISYMHTKFCNQVFHIFYLSIFALVVSRSRYWSSRSSYSRVFYMCIKLKDGEKTTLCNMYSIYVLNKMAFIYNFHNTWWGFKRSTIHIWACTGVYYCHVSGFYNLWTNLVESATFLLHSCQFFCRCCNLALKFV